MGLHHLLSTLRSYQRGIQVSVGANQTILQVLVTILALEHVGFKACRKE